MLFSLNLGAQSLPGGFDAVDVIAVPSPTSLAFLPDGRMLITSQGGTVRLLTAGALTTALSFNTSSSGAEPKVCTTSEGGVLGIAVDPLFTTNNYVYIFYTARNGASSCSAVNYNPSGDGVTYTAANQRVNRVSRFTFNTTTNTITPGSETILVDRMPARGGNHNAGDVHFGKDGFLYISIGDGGTDWTGSGSAGGNDAARDKHVLTGKILRITRDGDIPAGNPFTGGNTGRCNVNGTHTGVDAPGQPAHCQETYAWGLRNPFRFAMDPNAAATRFFINDVGQGSREEINLNQSGADYGWNCREGSVSNSTTGKCSPTPPMLVEPYFDYGRTANSGGLGIGSCASITGGAVVPNGIWPAPWAGEYLFADYACGGIFAIDATTAPGAGSSTVQATTFAAGLGSSSASSLRFGPDGSGYALYYTTYAGGGQVRKITYIASGNSPPVVASVTATPASSAGAPLTTTLTASASDPNAGNTLTYFWEFGDGTEATTPGNSTSKTYNSLGNYTVRVRARDNNLAFSNYGETLVQVGNTPPTPSISSPSSGSQFSVGQQVTLTGSANDTQDGTLASSALKWNVILHHASHTHPLLTNQVGNNIQFNAPAPEDLSAATNSYLEITLTATDSGGLTNTVSRDIQPLKRNLNLQSAAVGGGTISGIKLDVNGTTITTPQTVTVWAGWQLPVNVRDQNRGASGYRFANWSDAGARSHNYNTPNANSTLTVNFNVGALVPNLDVDNDGELTAANDGMLLMRYLLGFRDGSLVAGNVVGANAERSSASAIASYLDTVLASFDLDGRAGVNPATDGVLVVRYLLGISGAPLTAGTGSLNNATVVKDALDLLKP
jgi:glucose/arabinose dehydrogenase